MGSAEASAVRQSQHAQKLYIPPKTQNPKLNTPKNFTFRPKLKTQNSTRPKTLHSAQNSKPKTQHAQKLYIPPKTQNPKLNTPKNFTFRPKLKTQNSTRPKTL